MEPKKQYDFNTPVERTATELAKMILAKLDEAKDFIVIENYEKADPVTKAAFIEKSTDFSIDVLKAISLSDIPYPYATKAVDKVIQVLESLKQYIDGTINQSRHELASRLLGVRSPDNNKFTEELSTYGNVMLKLEELRTSQGNDMNDYFTVPQAPAPEATPGVELSPDAKKELGLADGTDQG